MLGNLAAEAGDACAPPDAAALVEVAAGAVAGAFVAVAAAPVVTVAPGVFVLAAVAVALGDCACTAVVPTTAKTAIPIVAAIMVNRVLFTRFLLALVAAEQRRNAQDYTGRT